MPAIRPLFSERLRTDWRRSAKPFHRLASVALMLVTSAVAATEPANAQAQTIDLSSPPIGAPPHDFEFWRAGAAEPDHWTVVRDAASDSSVSIQRSGREPCGHPLGPLVIGPTGCLAKFVSTKLNLNLIEKIEIDCQLVLLGPADPPGCEGGSPFKLCSPLDICERV